MAKTYTHTYIYTHWIIYILKFVLYKLYYNYIESLFITIIIHLLFLIVILTQQISLQFNCKYLHFRDDLYFFSNLKFIVLLNFCYIRIECATEYSYNLYTHIFE